MTVGETMRHLRDVLSPKYGRDETRAMTRLIFYSLKGWTATDMIIHEGDEVSDYIQEKISGILSRLMKNEPIQYILGTAYFYGNDFEVNRSTLIPRQETEELVDMIVKKWGDTKDLQVLDLGTGSGAIAVSLARNLPFSEVSALDISEEALEVARRNANTLKAKVKFIHQDLFLYEPPSDSFDIIVSNPPYIDESEKWDMEANVLDYEPHTALFVPDADPLIFYSRIATLACRGLRKGGCLYFEINPRHCDELQCLLRMEGFEEVAAHHDIHRRWRFISAIKP